MQPELFPWHESIWSKWQQLLCQSRLHHAILFCAPKGSGKTALAMQLAKTLLCKNRQVEPCGLCQSCQLFDANTHPDFHWLKPDVEGKAIGVDTIRHGNNYALETSQLGGKRVILIQTAHHMGEAAANALLKTLEEPPQDCHFILLSHSLDAMLPTVVSRCNKWKAPLPDESSVQNWLSTNLNQAVSLQTVRLNRGAPLAAKAFVIEEKAALHCAITTAFLQYLLDENALFSVVELMTKSLNDGLKWLSFLLLDIIKLQQGVRDNIIHCELLNDLQRVSQTTSPVILANQLSSLNRLTSRLFYTPGLNVELLCIDWLSDFYSSSQDMMTGRNC